ncbi:helix-turn-helix transcriptional regulator [Amycolatopsis samaneae]|uniref:Helix-turn-helix transcriptional regulator n=1 Tax=Amycolatopsis samaneae TaxID=664691 RepID=A0ABW5GRV8_9PSEU
MTPASGLALARDPVPVERTGFATSDAEVAQALLGELRVRCRVHRGATGAFTLRVTREVIGELWLDQWRVEGGLSLDADPFRDFVFGFLTGGRWGGSTRREELRGRAGLVFTHSNRDAGVYTLRDAEWSGLRLPAGTVRRVAAEESGHGRVQFLGMGPVNTGMRDYWRSAVEFARGQLSAPDGPGRDPLVYAELANLLATVALGTFPNTTMTAEHLPSPGTAGPAALRRAIAFIEAHADQPLTLSGIADAARVGPRALQHAFRRHRATTPLRHLRRVRLDYAHRDLLAADPAAGDSVSAVGRRWGFPHPGRFAAHYGRVYGCSPHRTLLRDTP